MESNVDGTIEVYRSSHARECCCPPSRPDLIPPRRGANPPSRTVVTAAGRGGIVARALGYALMVACAVLLPTGESQAQEIALVSNIGEQHDGTISIRLGGEEVIPGIVSRENRAAQQFTTGSNGAGYTLTSVVLNLPQKNGSSVVHAAIHADDSSGNPGTRLITLTNPADPIGHNPAAAGNRTFTAPGDGLSLAANTKYYVVLTDAGSDISGNYTAAITESNSETTTQGFSIRNGRHHWNGVSWSTMNVVNNLRMEVRGTVTIPPLEVTLQLSDEDGLVFENVGNVTVTATASPASPVAFTVTVSADPVAPATADDFTLSTNRVLSFAANATASTGTVNVRVVDRDDPEPTDLVTISGAVSNAAIADPDDVTLTIINDDEDLPQDMAIDAPAEVSESAGTAAVTVTLTTRQNTAPVIDANVLYRRRPAETATSGDDYTPPPPISGAVLIAIVPVSAFSPNAARTAYVARHRFNIRVSSTTRIARRTRPSCSKSRQRAPTRANIPSPSATTMGRRKRPCVRS